MCCERNANYVSILFIYNFESLKFIPWENFSLLAFRCHAFNTFPVMFRRISPMGAHSLWNAKWKINIYVLHLAVRFEMNIVSRKLKIGILLSFDLLLSDYSVLFSISLCTYWTRKSILHKQYFFSHKVQSQSSHSLACFFFVVCTLFPAKASLNKTDLVNKSHEIKLRRPCTNPFYAYWMFSS